MVIKSEAKRLVYGEVYSPLRVDADMETMTRDEIIEAAHRFLLSGRVNKIDVEHSHEETGVLVCESYIAKKNDPDGFIDGAWVLGSYIKPDDIWEQVVKGELNGYSFSGSVTKIPLDVVVEVVEKMEGHTELSLREGLLPPHSHPLSLCFNDKGGVVPTMTEKSLGHTHSVLKTTATAPFMEHGHRIIIIGNG